MNAASMSNHHECLNVEEQMRNRRVYCYVPLIWFFASLGSWSKNEMDDLARFCARQSLLQGLLSFALMLIVVSLLCIAMGTHWLGSSEELVMTVVIAALFVFHAAQTGLRMYLGWQVSRGNLVVLPWLSRIVRKWLPESEELATPASF